MPLQHLDGRRTETCGLHLPKPRTTTTAFEVIEQLLLPWLGVSVEMTSVLHVQTHVAAANASRRTSKKRSTHTGPPPGFAACSLATTTPATARDDYERLGFSIWYLDGEGTPLQMKFVAADEDSLWNWVQGLRCAVPERDRERLSSTSQRSQS